MSVWERGRETKRRIDIPGFGPLSPGDAIEKAFAAHQQGNRQAAARLCEAVLEKIPRQTQALYLLGIVALEDGQLNIAERRFRNVIATAPADPLGPGGLGMVRLTQQKFEHAIVLFQQCLKMAPDQPHIYNNLGLALWSFGDRVSAHRHFRQALNLVPDYADAHLNLGKLLFEQGEAQRAIAHYEKAIVLSPGLFEAHNNLGNVYRRNGELDRACECYEAALNVNPRFVQALFNMAAVKIEQGDLAAALEGFQRVVSMQPDHVEAVSHIGELYDTLGESKTAREWYSRALSLADDDTLPMEKRRARLFALGGVHDRLGKYEQAFDYFKLANDLWVQFLRRSGGSYDPVAQEAATKNVVSGFSRERVRRWEGEGNASRLPVFVLGMPRSGTSLIEQILASHPLVHGAGELPDLPDMAARMADGGSWVQATIEMDRQTLAKLADEYLQALRRKSDQALVITNKLPMNFLYIGLIRRLFPNSTIIHCRRDPRDTCLSNYFGYFAEPKNFRSNLADLGHFYRQYEILMTHWERLFSGSILHIDYEVLVDDLEGVSRDMIAHCGLEWDERCLSFHETKREVLTASRLQVRRPLYTSAVGRWRHYADHLETLNKTLQHQFPAV